MNQGEFDEYRRIAMKAKQIFMRSSHGLETLQKKFEAIKNSCKDKEKENLLESISGMLKDEDLVIETSTNQQNHTSIDQQIQHQSPT